MPALHILNRSPHEGGTFARTLSLLQTGDALLLTGDAVIGAAEGHPQAQELGSLSGVKVYALEADLLARGLQAGEAIDTVDYSGFVRLTEDYARLRHWH
ncbi:sulfurtransferase complex subunit TusB [Granulosicoccaceae sp. 1_MG-2023]|nr:sulfurtransferase complex subunit TusB [Granulosicoccaceae sp. 1_MG-2023]